MLEVKIKKLDDKVRDLPKYATNGSAGFDLKARTDEDITIKPNEIKLIKTGLAFELPEGYEGQVRSRSGLALKNGIFVLNSPGTIDSDYRGEIKCALINLGQEDFVVNHGDRIAQLVISPVCVAEINVKDILDDTQRGTGGFGSTGV